MLCTIRQGSLTYYDIHDRPVLVVWYYRPRVNA